MDKELLATTLVEHYGIQGATIEEMAGYEIFNYRIVTETTKYVLKQYPLDDILLDEVRSENEVLHSLSHHDGYFPRPIPDVTGEDLVILPKRGAFLRLLTYLEGSFLAETERTDDLIASFGSLLAKMDLDLLHIRDANIERRRTAWDLDHFLLCEQYVNLVIDPNDRNIAAYFIMQWKARVMERLPSLRSSTIHNDGNDWNVLVNNGKVSGLIDFGDIVYSRLIYEIAIAAAYLCLDQEDPVTIVSKLLAAYNSHLPLQAKEVDILYYLIAGRLCTSVLHSAKSKAEKSTNEYITISERGAWSLLHRLISINPEEAQRTWLSAIDIPIHAAKDDLLLRRQKTIPSVLSISYDRPIHMSAAAFQYMYDAEGNTFLDAYNNIIHVGHCHPKVVAAGQSAMATLNTNTRYLYEGLNDYSEHLLEHFPAHLDKVFLVNSGSAAADLAIRLATTHTKRQKVVVMEHGYHGNTSSGIDLSHYKYGHKGGRGRKSDILQATLPDTYRGMYQEDGAGSKYAGDLIDSLRLDNPNDIAAFIAEPIVGCGGQVPLASGYLKEVYKYMRSIGGLCISDEVQVGFGRLGDHFWGYQMHGVIPDIVILGKPIGNGHPMAAVVTSSAIAQSFDNGMEFFSSFGGNPVSCAIGNAVLTVIEEEKLQSHAKAIGDHLRSHLLVLGQRHPCIGDVRGSGLFLGVDIVKDPISKEPDPTLARHMINQLRERNILTSLDGPYNNVIKIKPPLCFNKKNANRLLNEVEFILKVTK